MERVQLYPYRIRTGCAVNVLSLMHASIVRRRIELMEEKARIIQELVPGKQVTIAHLIAHPDEDLAKKMGVPGAEAVGILTLSLVKRL